MNIIDELVSTAQHLAAIQIEGVVDYSGFNNADKSLGGHLAAIVSADHSNEEALSSLASLVAVKYQRQTADIVGEDKLKLMKLYAKGGKITQAQRDEARMTIIAQPDVHPKFGKRILFAFQFNQDFSFAIKDNSDSRPFSGPDGFKWPVKPQHIARVVAALKLKGAKIVGDFALEGINAAEMPERKVYGMVQSASKIKVWSEVFDLPISECIKHVPAYERAYDATTRMWTIPSYRLAEIVQIMEALPGDPVDCTELHALAAYVPIVAQTSDVFSAADSEIVIDPVKYAQLRDYQKTGAKFLTQPILPIRTSMEGGATIRGFILGDDMGLGKSIQSIIAADAVAGPNGSILCVVPATLKYNWRKEIIKWLKIDASEINLVEGQQCKGCGHGSGMHTQGPCLTKIETATNKIIKKETRINAGTEKLERIVWHYCDCKEAPVGGPSLTHRWNIINYDIVADWYGQLEDLKYDVLCIDEGHYFKNRDSIRAKTIVGGRVPMLRRQNQKDARDIKLESVSGLVSQANKRVFVLTGTPLTNRVADLFNLLRAIGHPLGRNFKFFGDRYCDPQLNVGKFGKVFGTTYNGASNMQELRSRVAPIFLQRKAEDYLHELPGRQLNWLAVEVDIKEYNRVMREYESRRQQGLLSSTGDHLALLNEARICAALSKVKPTIEYAMNAMEQGHKVIIGSQYKRVVDKLAEHFSSEEVKKQYGDCFVTFVGDKSAKQKDSVVDSFQDDPTKLVFIGTYTNGQSMATGLNLTAASVVIVNDLDWVPANIKQLYKRADRIGQTNFVNVVFMIAANTFDETLAVMLESKLEVVNDFEEVEGRFFDDFINRLAEAPQNLEAKALMDARFKSKGAV